MIKIHPKIDIPKKVYVAFSGGVDSLAIAHFLKNGGRTVELVHFDHGCPVSADIRDACIELASNFKFDLTIKKIDDPVCPPGRSIEDFWRRNRYRWLRSFDGVVITGHHLNDAVETWLWSAIHGNPKLIPIESGNIIRPFIITPKREFIKYAEKHNLNVVTDACNFDMSLTRNYMRVNLIPVVEHINPGIEKVILKKYLENSNE